MILSRKNSFTLVEILIAAVIGVVLLESIYVILFIGQKAWSNYSSDVLPKQEARNALIFMTRELRQAKNPLIESASDSARINFDVPYTGSVSYEWKTSGEHANNIIRTNNEQKRTIARNITALSFAAPIDSRIDISLGAGKTKDFMLTETVVMRSKTSMLVKGQNEAIK